VPRDIVVAAVPKRRRHTLTSDHQLIAIAVVSVSAQGVALYALAISVAVALCLMLASRNLAARLSPG
jgi:hypothetical protein